jgi:2-iminobutanoate/2-iminopropanoate deaminase
MVFCTGQVAIDPETNHLVEGDIKAQTRRVMENLGAVLEAAGSSLRHVVKTTVFLANFHDFPDMNEVYEHYFGDAEPARSTIEGGLPRGMLVQIDCIAIVQCLVLSIRVVVARVSQSTFDLDLDRVF